MMLRHTSARFGVSIRIDMLHLRQTLHKQIIKEHHEVIRNAFNTNKNEVSETCNYRYAKKLENSLTS